MIEMLDEEHPMLLRSLADHNIYSLRSINSHNIIIAGLYQPRNCPAAIVITQMRITFPNLCFSLLVSISSRVPIKIDKGIIQLSYMVISKPIGGHSGTLQYDHGKARNS